MIKLGDFELADEIYDLDGYLDDCVGTPLYMSPDNWNQKYSFNSDVWYN